MYQKVKAYMKEHGMVVDGDVVLAGVSGGGDSMAMLEMLKRYQAEAAFSLCAVHVHHGIRGEEADRDERVVRETCEKWTIPFLSYHYPVPELAKKWKMGLEETGRKVRQDAFSRRNLTCTYFPCSGLNLFPVHRHCLRLPPHLNLFHFRLDRRDCPSPLIPFSYYGQWLRLSYFRQSQHSWTYPQGM